VVIERCKVNLSLVDGLTSEETLVFQFYLQLLLLQVGNNLLRNSLENLASIFIIEGSHIEKVREHLLLFLLDFYFYAAKLRGDQRVNAAKLDLELSLGNVIVYLRGKSSFNFFAHYREGLPLVLERSLDRGEASTGLLRFLSQGASQGPEFVMLGLSLHRFRTFKSLLGFRYEIQLLVSILLGDLSNPLLALLFRYSKQKGRGQVRHYVCHVV